MSGPRVIAMTSGETGVGKTTLTLDIGRALAAAGDRVVLLDADPGAGDLRDRLGIDTSESVQAVRTGRQCFADEWTVSADGLRLIRAGWAAARGELAAAMQHRLLDEVEALDGRFDVLFVDLPSGASSATLFFAAAAHDTVLVLMPNRASVETTAQLVGALAKHGAPRTVSVLVNRSTGSDEARATFRALAGRTVAHTAIGLEYLGWVPNGDGRDGATGALAGSIHEREAASAHGGLQFFFRTLVTTREAA